MKTVFTIGEFSRVTGLSVTEKWTPAKQQALEWAAGISIQTIDYLSRSFSALRTNVLATIDLAMPLEQLERDLTSHHFLELQHLWAIETRGYCSFAPHHEPPEMETRSPAPARPPAYDLAFVWQRNRRVAWPVEAKVLPTPNTLAEYLSDTKKFLSGTAAPFTGRGSQIAYLLTGTCEKFFGSLSGSLELTPSSAPERHQKSIHPLDDSSALVIHHLAFLLVSRNRP